MSSKAKKEITYPCLMVIPEDAAIVLFMEEEKGTVVHRGNGPYEVGYSAPAWDMDCFEPLEGIVELLDKARAGKVLKMKKSSVNVGDIVEPYDGSYAFKIEDGRLKPSHGTQMIGRDFEVIAIGCCFPVNSSRIDSAPNDVMLRALDNNQTVFMSSDQMSLRHSCGATSKPKCSACGNHY